MGRPASSNQTRDRLLLSAARLLHESGGRTVSTRAICERAGVQAPTLYHHFGSKQGLIDAVIRHGFEQYLEPDWADGATVDPVDAVRDGWDRHVRFGLDHPGFYALLYGAVERGRPCAITGPALARLTALLERAASAGRLRVRAADAAAQLLAANVGVTLSLIAEAEDRADLPLSEQVREAILSAVCVPPHGAAEPRAAAAAALAATLDGHSGLTAGETALLRELLQRLGAGVSEPRPASQSDLPRPADPQSCRKGRTRTSGPPPSNEP
jgi:AcrR family transcriptional regulator